MQFSNYNQGKSKILTAYYYYYSDGRSWLFYISFLNLVSSFPSDAEGAVSIQL